MVDKVVNWQELVIKSQLLVCEVFEEGLGQVALYLR
jgi:hypothetical protein